MSSLQHKEVLFGFDGSDARHQVTDQSSLAAEDRGRAAAVEAHEAPHCLPTARFKRGLGHGKASHAGLSKSQIGRLFHGQVEGEGIDAALEHSLP
jgi:hypothetical protein